MENTRLPDLNRLRGVKKRLKSLPPQESPTDTSNWEDRNVSAPVMDTEKKKSKVRELAFINSSGIKLKDLILDQKQKAEEKDTK